MIIIINGAFGVGKTTVGRLLWRRIAGSRLYNPEWAGSVLMRIPFVRFKGSGTGDFQDIDLWRKSVISGTRMFQRLSGGTVIAPMTFCRRDYFDEIVGGMREFDDEIRAFCLKAGMETIRKRLEQRGGETDWPLRKAQECIEAHEDIHFGEPVDTEGINAEEVAKEVLGRLDVSVAQA
jgi:deoxyadenosine/deoxycytidine kinase